MSRDKIKKLIEMLKEGTYTLEELIEGSGLQKATVKIQITYRFKKAGMDVKITQKDGQVAYTLQEIE